ncbi:Pentapeptide repeat-containing protein [Sodalis praecaptivus]|uniref:Pentapeptide repeat-containing protein n=1 Tax=Sodalis praecaptivus TaxID=1239307 RepID=W0HW08_9GAMM|nr:pentapeptide repeat-containing protein [Sodalis praecaptivus]AHF77939.1 Pentapeptide repeat-containing protein [Sodalis praecaptivus]
MNTADLKKILDDHKVWVESLYLSGSRANLCGANLCDANLCGADLPEKTFVRMGGAYPVFITNGEYVRAGCQNHTVDKWRRFTKKDIADMDGRKALRFYPILLDIIDFHLGKGDRPEWLSEPDSEEAA